MQAGIVSFGTNDTIRVTHNGGFISQYSPVSSRLVANGTRVRKGQILGFLQKRKKDEYILYFELFKRNVAVNPEKYLPNSKKK